MLFGMEATLDYREEFEQEKMGRLVFRMAMPSVAAGAVRAGPFRKMRAGRIGLQIWAR